MKLPDWTRPLLLFPLALLALWATFLADRRAAPQPKPATRIVTVTRVDTVPAQVIEKAEPKDKPSAIGRVLTHKVDPDLVQVAPGAGRTLLAGLCRDTARALSVAALQGLDSAQAQLATIAPPADTQRIAYGWKARAGWTPWSRTRFEWFEVTTAGDKERRVEHARLPAEGMFLTGTTRESRIAGLLKPLPFTALVFTAGILASGPVRGAIKKAVP